MHTQVTQPLMLTRVRHRPLDPRKAVLERRHNQIRAGEIGPRLRRPPPEQLLIELHHRIRDLHHQQPTALLLRARLRSRDFGVHDIPALPSSQAEGRAEGREREPSGRRSAPPTLAPNPPAATPHLGSARALHTTARLTPRTHAAPLSSRWEA